MKQYLTITFCLFGIILFGQDTTHYDNEWNKVKSINEFKYYKIITHNQVDTNRASESAYFKSGQIKSERRYSNYKKKELDGNCKEYFENGQLKREIAYKYGKLNGQLFTYWNTGLPKRIDNYENDKLIEGQCFNSQGKDTLYFPYEKMAAFKGGENALFQYIGGKIKYPTLSKDNGIQGTIYISFTITKNGNVSEVKVLRGINDEINAEAMRVIQSMPKWIAGMQDGETENAAFTVPINFILR